ncbi:MAG: hypothetical protein ACPGVH_05905 [Chitinophagales bacterium]
MKILKKGKKGKKLNYAFYNSLVNALGFPKIPKKAEDINYFYRYDGYLPKYIFNLCYKLPKQSAVKVFEESKNGFIKIQTCMEDDFYKTVKYTEFQE